MTKLSDPIPVKRHGAEPMERFAKKLARRAKEQALAQGNERESLRKQIAEAYKSRFEQQSVGLIIGPACIRF